MRVGLIISILLSVAVGCGGGSNPNLAKPTALHFPPTWTPEPTSTAAPPPPTATLVLQALPGEPTSTVGNARPYPVPVGSKIGMWVDTGEMSADVLRSLPSRVQVAVGPKATTLRQNNSRIIILAQVDSAEQQDAVSSAAGPLDLGYDGILLRNVGMVTAADPLAASDKLLAAVRETLGPRLIVADGYPWRDGAAFEEHSAASTSLLREVDGICLCGFLRTSDAALSGFKTEEEWKRDIDALARLSSYPNLIVLVATRFDQVKPEELDKLQPWFDFAITSFLIGENGQFTYFSFQGAEADDYMAAGEFDSPLGSPLGAYFPSYGLFARRFQHGLVVVNAGQSAREMPLTQLYETSSGEQVTSAQVQPHSGQILLSVP